MKLVLKIAKAIVSRKIVWSSALVSLTALAGFLLYSPAVGATANGCTVGSGDSTVTFDNTVKANSGVNITTAGTYTLWLRMQAPDSTNNTLRVSVDGGTCITMGAKSGSSVPITPNWGWEDTQNGTTTTVTFSLAVNTNHTMVVVGNNGVALDSFIFTQDPSCVPNNTLSGGVAGTNCTTNQPTPPTVSFAAPTANATVSGNVTLTATATDANSTPSVQFKVDGANVGSAITASPYTTTWNSTTVADGTHTLTAVATNAANLQTTVNETVTVANNVCNSTPSAPTNVHDTDTSPLPANKVDLAWTAVTAPTNCTLSGYNIYRGTTSSNLTKIAGPVSLGANPTYSDTTVAANTNYFYQVSAVDTSGTTPEGAKAPATPLSVTTGQNCTNGVGQPTTPTVSVSGVTYTTVSLSWTASTVNNGCTLSGYNVFRNGSSTPINSSLITTTSFTDTGQGLTPANLSSGTTYSYTVVAVDSGSNKSTAGTASATTQADNVAPTLPSAVSATANSASSITVNWGASTDLPNPGAVGLAGYKVYRCTGTGCQSSLSSTNFLIQVSATTTSYQDLNLAASTTYGYAVTAIDKNGNEDSVASAGTASATTQAAPPQCTGNPSPAPVVSQGASTVSSIGLTWTASNPATACTLAGYQVFRNNVQVGSTNATTTTFNDSPLAQGSYSYFVVASDTNNHKVQSATVTFSTAPDTTPPNAPTNFTASNVSGGVSLNWTAATDNVGVTNYMVTRTNGGANTQNFNVGNVTSYLDASVSASTTYNYSVTAFDAAGNPSTAATTSITTPAPTCTGQPSPPGTPVADTITSTGVHLTWTASTPAAGCTISGYKVMNGTIVVSGSSLVSGLNTSINGLTANTQYSLTVVAVDSSNHSSNPSGAVTFTTQPASITPVAGDINGDSVVDTKDFTILVIYWGNGQPIPSYTNGDPNLDGVTVNTAVFTRFLIDWGAFTGV